MRLGPGRRWPATIVLAAAVGLAACGTAGSTSSTTRASLARPARPGSLGTSPRTGHAGTTFRFSFRAPRTAGRHGSFMVSYELGVTGPQRTGCQAERGAAVASASARRWVTVALTPLPTDPWCIGRYRAQVSEVEGPYCRPGTMCPQFLRLVGIVARGAFTVRPG